MKFNHIGIPTAGSFDGEIPLPHLKITVSDHQANPFGIQWQRYWEDAPYPDLVKTVPHVAFEVDDLTAALEDQHVIIEPNSPSRGVLVAFIEVSGAPVELTVTEFLAFCARLHGLARDADAAVARAIDRCGLGDVRRRLIGAARHGRHTG